MDLAIRSMFVEQVRADAERGFGRAADPVVVEHFAHRAVCDLWQAGPKVSDFVAELALRQVRTTLATWEGPVTVTLAAD